MKIRLSNKHKIINQYLLSKGVSKIEFINKTKEVLKDEALLLKAIQFTNNENS
jgi:hypothetical protein